MAGVRTWRPQILAADGLVLTVSEGGRLVGVHALFATGVNGEGHPEAVRQGPGRSG